MQNTFNPFIESRHSYGSIFENIHCTSLRIRDHEYSVTSVKRFHQSTIHKTFISFSKNVLQNFLPRSSAKISWLKPSAVICKILNKQLQYLVRGKNSPFMPPGAKTNCYAS